MHSLASATALLDACNSAEAVAPLLEAIGFARELIPLGSENLGKLGLFGSVTAPHLARGPGGLRALVFETSEAADLRGELARVAARVSASASRYLWILAAVDRERGTMAVAGIDAAHTRPRIAALISRRGHVVDSDAETICALAAAHGDSDLLTHCRWLEILGRESVSRSFFRQLEKMVSRLASSIRPAVRELESSELALLYTSRLLFLSFLQTKGWLDRDHRFLDNRFADCMATGGGYHRRVLAPLFFGTLNTSPGNRAARARAFGRIPFLNGGLFARSELERATARFFFPDDTLGELFGELLSRYRFTAREDSTTWSEAAVDPEMLGKAFESLMSAQARRRSGAFYTPQSLVEHVSRCALAEVLRCRTLRAADDIRVLDPACGSGAFLVHILEELSQFRARLGDTRPMHRIRRQVLTTCIFGVDVNPVAVWLCELRLWLAMAIEDPQTDPMRVTPLPNLDRNIRIGDSLAGEDFREARLILPAGPVGRLRSRYAAATGPRKRNLARMLDAAERRCAIAASSGRMTRLRRERRDTIAVARSRDLFGQRAHSGAVARRKLAALRLEMRVVTRELRLLKSGGALPFSFRSGFADVASSGGFDVIVGNPPWVRPHNLDRTSRASLRSSFEVYRNAAWREGSAAAAAGSGFGSQADVAALFIERSVFLLRPGGTLSLIVPSKLWKSLAGGGVREFLMRRATLSSLHDYGSSDVSFEAAAYPSVITSRRGTAPGSIDVVAHRGGQTRGWRTSPEEIGLDGSAGSPWILAPPSARAAFDAVTAHGIRLGESPPGRPFLGVKTGCNDAFVVTESHRDDSSGLSGIHGARTSGTIERHMLRHVVRGEQVRPWRIAAGDSRIIWTHDERGRPMRTLPPAAARWLAPWRATLEARADSRGATQWWGMFRLDSADASRARVVWTDIARSPRAAIIPPGDATVILNTCYCVRCRSLDHAFALAAILNSTLAAAWLNMVAEPARGGFRRYMGWTMAILPVPRDWDRAVSLLARTGREAFEGSPPEPSTLDDVVADAYGLAHSTIAPLLEWSG